MFWAILEWYFILSIFLLIKLHILNCSLLGCKALLKLHSTGHENPRSNLILLGGGGWGKGAPCNWNSPPPPPSAPPLMLLPISKYFAITVGLTCLSAPFRQCPPPPPLFVFVFCRRLMMSWCLMSSDVIWHIRDKLWPMPKHGSIKSTYVRCMHV